MYNKTGEMWRCHWRRRLAVHELVLETQTDVGKAQAFSF
jgi:hypothetical protein